VLHFRDGFRGAIPGERRIDEQQRAALAAVAVRDEQRARSDVHVARERRDAKEVEPVDGVEREDPGAARGRADNVVIRERRAVVRVGAREYVACDPARVVARRRIGPDVRYRTRDARELRLGEHGLDGARRVRRNRHAAVDFLVLDVLGARRAHALDHEVEAVFLVLADAVVIDGGAQELARAGRERLQHEPLHARRQLDRAATRAVGDAHHDRRAPAVLEILLDRIRQRRRLPEASEDALEFVEAGDCDGSVHRAAQAAADERRDGRRRFPD